MKTQVAMRTETGRASARESVVRGSHDRRPGAHVRLGRLRDRRGLTLIEVVAALLLLAALSAIAWRSLHDANWRFHAAVLKTDLRNLAAKQEAFFSADRGTMTLSSLAAPGLNHPASPHYARSLDELGFVPSPGVTIELRGAATGWAAQAQHEKLASRDYLCAIFVGDAAPFAPAVEEGQVTCGSSGDTAAGDAADELDLKKQLKDNKDKEQKKVKSF